MTEAVIAPQVASWIASRLPEVADKTVKAHEAIGLSKDGELIGGVLIHDFSQHSVDMSAVINEDCLKRNVLKSVFGRAFRYHGKTRVTLKIPRKQKCIREFVGRLGFKEEGVMRRAFDGKQDLVIYGMLKDECRWI